MILECVVQENALVYLKAQQRIDLLLIVTFLFCFTLFLFLIASYYRRLSLDVKMKKNIRKKTVLLAPQGLKAHYFFFFFNDHGIWSVIRCYT